MAESPITIKSRRARVMATFMRRVSDKKTHLAGVVGAHEGQQNHFLFPTLKTVHGAHFQPGARSATTDAPGHRKGCDERPFPGSSPASASSAHNFKPSPLRRRFSRLSGARSRNR